MKAVGAIILIGAILLALFMAGRPNDELLIDEPDQAMMIPAAGDWCDMRPVLRQRPRVKHLDPVNPFEPDQRSIS